MADIFGTVTAHLYVDSILKLVESPFLLLHPRFTFVSVNARPHTTHDPIVTSRTNSFYVSHNILFG